jgi:hypothetical protein
MPTDEAQQAKLRASAAQAVTWTMTFCERNGPTCATASDLWATFRAKAEFAGKVVYGLVMEANDAPPGPRPAEAPPGAVAPVRTEPPPVRRQPPLFERGTLTDQDLKPQWRGNSFARSEG